MLLYIYASKGFIARPAHHAVQKRYTLDELLQNVTSKNIKALNKKTQWAREGKSIGRELT